MSELVVVYEFDKPVTARASAPERHGGWAAVMSEKLMGNRCRAASTHGS
ncbi:hypothetical protein ABZ467_38995 [Streptomyces sp. NPDC005727]